MLIPDPPERLSGERIALRPISAWDIPEILIAHQDDPHLAADIGLSRPPSGAQLGQEVERAPADWAAGILKFSLVEPGSEDCRGRLTVEVIDPVESTARATVWVVPQRRGRGYATEALALARDWLASRGGIEQLQCGEDRPRGG